MRSIFFIYSVAFTFSLFANVLPEQRYSELTDLVVEIEPYSWDKALSAWNAYKSDECLLRDRNVANEAELRKIGLRRCKDQSVSFVQPNSRGWNGWEGKCGQTAAANSLYHFCKIGKDPKVYIDEYLGDSTPGVRPGTLRKGINKLFKKHCSKVQWDKRSFRKPQDFISYINLTLMPKLSQTGQIVLVRDGEQRVRQPVIVLIQNPGTKYLHWVTVVDKVGTPQSCKYIVNHWDDQYIVPCKDLAQWSLDVGRTYPVILRSLSVVSPK